MRSLSWAFVALSLGGPAASLAQNELAGKDQFPQFRTLSGLPGGAFGVRPDGSTGIDGALAISTPVAYSLGRWHGTLGFSIVGLERKLVFNVFSRSERGASDSTAQGMIGLPLGRAGQLTVGGMLLSRIGDTVMNLQYTPPGQEGPSALAVGVQDLFDTGGNAGEKIDPQKGRGRSRSVYLVGTTELPGRIYLSAGFGSRRFRGGFGGASAPLGDRARLALEYDGFNWNYGLGADLGSFPAPRVGKLAATGFVGMIRGKYPMLAINFSF